MTPLEAVITASERTLADLEDKRERTPVEFTVTLGNLTGAIYREQTFLGHLRDVQAEGLG
jgi:hypothetical protein